MKWGKEFNAQMPEEILTANDVCKMLNVYPPTVQHMASQGILPGFKVGGRWRFHRATVEAYIRQKEQARADRLQRFYEKRGSQLQLFQQRRAERLAQQDDN
jgi:excisionase family DNA binding protein